MPRKNANAQKVTHTRQLRLDSKPRKRRWQAVLIPKHKIKDDISPGWLRAAAEWKRV